MKSFLKNRKKAISYLKKHVEFNAFIHALGGIGFGILLANLLSGIQTMLIILGVIFCALSLLGHLYSFMQSE
jgi:hypothetical protein